jgi:hypothetical protein
MDNVNKNLEGGVTQGRIIWLDPNKSKNVMVNPEDLSINVEFKSFRKGRSLIFSGEEINNTENTTSSISFIEGSNKNNKTDERSLTTRYTSSVHLDLMNPNDSQSDGSIDDYESLGIESIDIEFNTAYTPIIKIKFIDVRGNSILSKGNSSKYKMFFELPYPLFSLKVKGFYGKSVNYCLHLQRWNANFNAETGNFEIQADFIGYTYAFLTDMIIGLVRANSYTLRGETKLIEKKAQSKTPNLVITIDQMLKKTQELNFDFGKVNETTNAAEEILTYDKIFENVDLFKKQLNNLVDEIGDNKEIIRGKDNSFIVIPHNTTNYKENIKKVNEFKEGIVSSFVETVNIDIELNDLKFNTVNLNKIGVIKNIPKNELTTSNYRNNMIIREVDSNLYNIPNSNSVNEKLDTIYNNINLSLISDNTSVDIFVFSDVYNYINKQVSELDDRKKNTEIDLVKEITQKTINYLGFEPTIKNIFTVLSINTEIFLETLKDVSIAAQKKENKNRLNEISKLFNYKDNFNVKIENKDIDIYAWPEYREKTGSDYVETYMGSNSLININNIDELIYTEELLEGFVKVSKFDDELNRLEEEIPGLDIDSLDESIEHEWWPISAIDTPLSNNMLENPYFTVLNSNPKAEEIIRLLIYRCFLLLGITYRNSNIPTKKDTIESTVRLPTLENYARLEAHNVISALKTLGENGKLIGKLLINNYTNKDSVVSFGLEGSDKNIKNPTGIKKPIFKEVNESYEYTYIGNSSLNQWYIPVNGNFDGTIFYSDKKILDSSELKRISNNGVLFVSNPINDTFLKYQKENDGSYLFKIIEKTKYENTNLSPAFGVEDLNLDGANQNEQVGLNLDTIYDSIVKNPNSSKVGIKGVRPFIGRYSNIELNTINNVLSTSGCKFEQYIGEGYPANEVVPSILSFHTQYMYDKPINDSITKHCGTYLCNEFDAKNINNIKLDNETIELTQIWRNKLEKTYKQAGQLKTGGVRNSFINNAYGLTKDLIIDKSNGNIDNLYLPFIEFGTSFNSESNKKYRGNWNLPLFGSWFYNQQKKREVKALLLLHTIPWQGVKNFADNIAEYMMLDKYSDWGFNEEDRRCNNTYTRINSIKGLFKGVGGFVSTPKGWVLFIGGMLWRWRNALENNGEDPIIFKDIYNNNDYNTLIDTKNSVLPSFNSFLYFSNEEGGDGYAEYNPWGMYFDHRANKTINPNPKNSNGAKLDDYLYVPIDRTIRNLPKQIKDEFINYFEQWVNNDINGFSYIQRELEIWSGFDRNTNANANDYKNLYESLNTDTEEKFPVNPVKIVKKQKLNELFSETVVKNYVYISPSNKLNDADIGTFSMILAPSTPVMSVLTDLFTNELILQNVNPSTWVTIKPSDSGTFKPGRAIRAKKDKFDLFLETFLETFKKIEENDLSKTTFIDEDDETKLKIFGSVDDNQIKLQIYRTLSSINDKWINGNTTGCLLSQCGNQKPTSGCETISETFRFVDRAFKDIGDDFYLHMNYISNIIKGNYNQSFFDITNEILNNNNFNFIPLPTFFNFNNLDELKTAFTPYSYVDVANVLGNGGPAFVCVYVGQSSKNLDLGVDSVYPDDGLSISYDSDSNSLTIPEGAEDFSSESSGNGNVPIFSVNYGQQNQNYFKSLVLDQREFAETMESLQVIEQISTGGDKSKSSYIGNNLFNVYQTRSYSAEVEMLGSAMIQPMMYFQLNNVPMFRGAYLIYKVTHTIKPHTMTTKFKGNRVKKTKTPLLDKTTVYMNLLGQTGLSAPIGSGRIPNSALPIIKTLIDNGVSNGYIELNKSYGQITTKTVISNPNYFVNKSTPKYLITEAAEALEVMLLDWGKYMESEGYKRNSDGYYIKVGSLYRGFESQAGLNSKQKTAAPAGTSYHGWGVAVDMSWVNKNGKMLSFNYSGGSTPDEFKFETNPALKWLYDNSYKYGYINPEWARDGGSYDEVWHWEYHGKSAMCLLRKNNKVKYSGYVIPIKENDVYNPIVKNPKKPDGVEDDYGNNCSYVKIKARDGSDFTPIPDGDKKENIKNITKTLKSLGITREGAIGFIGNILGESSANPKAIEKKDQPIIGGKGGIGIVQWTASRRRRLEEMANKDKDTIVNLGFQLKVLSDELNDKYKTTVLNPLKNSKDIIESTKIVLEKFEIPMSYVLTLPSSDDKRKERGITLAEAKVQYQKTVDKRYNLGLSAEDIINEIYNNT